MRHWVNSYPTSEQIQGSIWSWITSSRTRYFARRKMHSTYCSCCGLSYSNWIRHNSSRSKFGWYSSGEVSMFSCNMTSNCVISCKCSWAVWTGYSYTLMALANMCSQISFITISSLTKRASKFCTLRYYSIVYLVSYLLFEFTFETSNVLN